METLATLDVDAAAAGLHSGLARALLTGGDRDLLAPLRFLSPGERPRGEPPAVERAALAGALAVANASYGHPRAAALAAKLADPATRVVVTGQQTGLLGGPLLAWVKAAAAVRWAETLESEGTPAVALFWMATEDHDWNEVARLGVPAAGATRELGLGADAQPLAPVGLRVVGDGITAVLAELERLYPAPWARARLARLAAHWRPEARFGEAFARQLVESFGARAPLAVDALLPELKRAEAPWMTRLVERREELAAAFAAREAELVRRGYAPQVAPAPEASPLFLLRGGARRRIEWRGAERYALRGAKSEEPVAELLATLEENPAVVSPGALARPALQDAVFGTTLQVMGPGELAYLAQAAAVYELLGLAAPWTTLRPSALVLGRRGRERLERLGLPLAEILCAPGRAARRLGEAAGGDLVAAPRAAIERALEGLGAAAGELDPALARAHRKTTYSVGRALERFAAKAATAAMRRDRALDEAWTRFLAECCPGGVPQERAVAAVHFELAWGDGFAPALLDGLALDARRLSVIDPGRGAEGA